jgi:hypothetical protein
MGGAKRRPYLQFLLVERICKLFLLYADAIASTSKLESISEVDFLTFGEKINL